MSNSNKNASKSKVSDDNFSESFSDSDNSSKAKGKVSNKKSTKANKANPQNYKKMTPAEIKEYLADSILIPKTEWLKLSVGSHISYYKNDNNFVKSGFIKAIYHNEDNDFIKYGTKLTTYHSDKYYKEFTVNVNNIKELYKKIDPSAILEYQIIKKNITQSMNTFLDKFVKIENELNDILNRISKLEDNHLKTIKFIKKLHNINTLEDIKHLN